MLQGIFESNTAKPSSPEFPGKKIEVWQELKRVSYSLIIDIEELSSKLQHQFSLSLNERAHKRNKPLHCCCDGNIAGVVDISSPYNNGKLVYYILGVYKSFFFAV